MSNVHSALHPARRLSRVPLIPAILAAAFAACDTGVASTEATAVDLSLAVVAASDSQSAAVGTSLPSVLAVKVVDQNQRPVTSVAVAWAVLEGGGTVGSSTSTTDSTGVATVSWLLGTTAGTQRVTATLINGKADTLMAVALPAEVQSLGVASEPFVAVPAGTLTAPLQVRALDRFGNPVQGITVQWSTSAGSLSTPTSVAAADGVA